MTAPQTNDDIASAVFGPDIVRLLVLGLQRLDAVDVDPTQRDAIVGMLWQADIVQLAWGFEIPTSLESMEPAP